MRASGLYSPSSSAQRALRTQPDVLNDEVAASNTPAIHRRRIVDGPGALWIEALIKHTVHI